MAAAVSTLQLLQGASVLLNAELELAAGFLQVSLELLVFLLQLPDDLRTLSPTSRRLLSLGQGVWMPGTWQSFEYVWVHEHNRADDRG